jgi:hypothetical protein
VRGARDEIRVALWRWTGRKVVPVTVLLFIAVSTSATPVRDQAYDDAGNLSAALAQEFAYVAQSVTAGIRGSLSAVEISALDQPTFALPWVVEIIAVSGGTPTGVVLASETVDLPSPVIFDVPRLFFRIDLSTPAFFDAGDSFAIALHPQGITGVSPGLFAGAWVGGTGNPYAGGQLFSGLTAETLTPDSPDFDLNFRTYVEPVPEPGTLVLLLTGIGLVALLRRHIYPLRRDVGDLSHAFNLDLVLVLQVPGMRTPHPPFEHKHSYSSWSQLEIAMQKERGSEATTYDYKVESVCFWGGHAAICRGEARNPGYHS